MTAVDVGGTQPVSARSPFGRRSEKPVNILSRTPEYGFNLRSLSPSLTASAASAGSSKGVYTAHVSCSQRFTSHQRHQT